MSAKEPVKGVILDADSLGRDIDLAPVTGLLDEWRVYPFTREADVMARVSDASIVLSNKVPITDEVMASAPSLQLISVMATGTNNVDIGAATARHITVTNAVAYATPSVVQHTINLMLTLATNLPRYAADTRRGAWQQADVFCRLDYPIVELAGKVLGIVGPGELGSNVAKVAAALGMEVLFTGRRDKGDRVTLDELLRRSDIVSLHCPLTEDNAEMINTDTLAQMKTGAFLINTARGGLVNPADLIAALERGTIAAAAVDVVSQEPPPADDLLTTTSLPNLIVTPHNAWGAVESRQRLIGQMAENISSFLNGSPTRTVSA